MAMQRKQLVIAGLIIAAFILATVSTIFYIDMVREQHKLDPAEIESMSRERIIQAIYERYAEGSTPFYYFIPIFAFFGIAVGASVYYVVERDVEKKEEIIEHNTDIILKLLDPDERKAINKIVENEGKVQQIEITYMEGFTKVKAHRIIEGLVQKGILTKESMGKMRLIRMHPDLLKILRKR